MDELTLIKYIEGTLEESKSTAVEEWITLSEENKNKIEHLYAINFIDKRIKALNAVDVDQKYFEFKQKVYSKKRKNNSLFIKISKVAAIAIILLTTTLFSSLFIINEYSNPIKVSTQLGERSQIKLPDGTEVWLNAFSELEYKKCFLSRKRLVTLTGEAYFDVSHNKALPFVISVDDSNIRVLGTKFNVRNNSDEDYIETTLIDGSIRFDNLHDNSKKILTPGDELRFNKLLYTVSINKIKDPLDKASWRNGVLNFENTTLEDICKSLERNFNIKIHFANEELKQERFTAEFEIADNIHQILSILELTNKFKLEINNREITILPI